MPLTTNDKSWLTSALNDFKRGGDTGPLLRQANRIGFDAKLRTALSEYSAQSNHAVVYRIDCDNAEEKHFKALAIVEAKSGHCPEDHEGEIQENLRIAKAALNSAQRERDDAEILAAAYKNRIIAGVEALLAS